jgi:hypothetical protein
LGAEGWFIEDLNHISVGVSEIERATAVAVRAGWMTKRGLASGEGRGSTVHIFGSSDKKTEMVEPLSFGGGARGRPVERKIVTAGREVRVFGVGLPDHAHAENRYIELDRAPDVCHI